MTILYRIIGIFALSLGIIGAFLPVMPTTCFVLLAAWCFAKSSPTWHRKLRENPFFGQMIKQWELNKTIPEGPYWIAVSSMTLSAIYSVYLFESIIFKLLAIGLCSAGIIFVSQFRKLTPRNH